MASSSDQNRPPSALAAKRASARAGNRCKLELRPGCQLTAAPAPTAGQPSSKITRLYQRPTGTEGNIGRRPTCEAQQRRVLLLWRALAP